MARSLTTGQRNALSADGVLKAELVELLFDTPLYFTNAGHDLVWDGKTWVGDGTLLSIAPIKESLALQAHGVQVELSGADGALVSFALNGLGKGKTLKVYVAALSPATNRIIGTPTLETSLTISVMRVVDAAGD